MSESTPVKGSSSLLKGTLDVDDDDDDNISISNMSPSSARGRAFLQEMSNLLDPPAMRHRADSIDPPEDDIFVDASSDDQQQEKPHPHYHHEQKQHGGVLPGPSESAMLDFMQDDGTKDFKMNMFSFYR